MNGNRDVISYITDPPGYGNLYVRYLIWNGDRWHSNFNWLDSDWNDNNFQDIVFFVQNVYTLATAHVDYYLRW